MNPNTILAIVFISILVLVIVLMNVFAAKKDPRRVIKKARIVPKLQKTGAIEAPIYNNDEKAIPANLIRINRETDKVLDLIGIAEPIDSISLVDDILNDRINEAALTIAQKLFIKHPRIVIEKAEKAEKDEQEHEMVASVLVSANNEAVFGTSAFNYQTIKITTYPGCNAYPDKFICVIAHELCHKILHSLDHDRTNDEQDERETDIAAVLSGFGNSYFAAKNVDEGLGYLSKDEALFLKQKAKKVLAEIKEARSSWHKEYVRLRQQNEEKIHFLNALCDASSLRNENEWDIDYTAVGDDYNKLLVCAKTISAQELDKYRKLCNYFRKLNSETNRYSAEILDSEQRFDELKEIVNRLQLPDFEYHGLLKKYQ